MQRDGSFARHDSRAVVDARRAKRLLGDPQPAAGADDRRLQVARVLLADATVSNVDDPIRDLRRGGIVTDENRRRAVLRRERREKRQNLACRLLVEIAGRLVGDEEPGPMRDRRAQRDSLLLSARELARQRVGTIGQANSLEELACARRRRGGGNTGQAERERDQLLRGELALERAPVVLVGVSEHLAAIPSELASRRVQDVDASDDERSGRRSGQAGESPHERGLAGAARSEHDAGLRVGHRKCEALERGNASCGRPVDGEQLTRVDERRRHSVSRYAGPRAPANACLVAPSDQQRREDGEDGDPGDDEERVDDHRQRRLRVTAAGRDRYDTRDEKEQSEPGDDPADEPDRRHGRSPDPDDAPEKCRRRALGLEIEVLTAVVA